MKKRIKLIFFDVDGTLTDGKIYMSENGEAFKAFNVKDGCGIKDIMPRYNIIPVIITGRKSVILEKRCNELGIIELYQGIHEKIPVMHEVMKKYDCNKNEIAYFGDDILDLPCIKECLVSGCPKDAVRVVQKKCRFISKKNAGDGAARDFIEWIIKKYVC